MLESASPFYGIGRVLESASPFYGINLADHTPLLSPYWALASTKEVVAP